MLGEISLTSRTAGRPKQMGLPVHQRFIGHHWSHDTIDSPLVFSKLCCYLRVLQTHNQVMELFTSPLLHSTILLVFCQV